MITLQDIEPLVCGGESELVEFKRSTGERREATRTICAMLNHRGGRVIFGIESNGRMIGQMVSDRTIEEVAQEIGEIDPPVFPSIERVDLTNEMQLVVVTIQSGSAPPYTYRGQAYRRVGNTSRQLSREEYNRMLLERLHSEQRWENQYATGWSISDLDTGEIVRTLEEAIRRGRADDPGGRDPAEILRGLGLLKDSQLLRAAVVLFGKSEKVEAEMPQCVLKVAHFKGNDKTEFLDNRQFHGNVFSLLRKSERFLRKTLPVAGRVQPHLFERVDDPLYPPVALREALANAFCHRDYSVGGGAVSLAVYDNRLEIASTGILHFGLTPEMLYRPHESLPWNPLIARVFYRCGVIEAWGRGTLKMEELTARAGLPSPEIVENSGCVLVRFSPAVPPAVRASDNLTELQHEISVLLKCHPSGLAYKQIRAEIVRDVPDWKIKNELNALKKIGFVTSMGRGRGSLWFLK